MITSESPSKTSQKIYSAQSCYTVTESKTEHDLKGRKNTMFCHWKRSQYHARIGTHENSIVSHGGIP